MVLTLNDRSPGVVVELEVRKGSRLESEETGRYFSVDVVFRPTLVRVSSRGSTPSALCPFIIFTGVDTTRPTTTGTLRWSRTVNPSRPNRSNSPSIVPH